MATLYADAVEIITDTGNGIPVTYSNSAIGLASDGHFYLITDRFGIAGSPKVITGDTARTTWYDAIMVQDRSAFGISRNADFVEAGCIESVSGMSFGIKNTAAFWSTLAANGVYLGRRTVKYYRVTSTDGITFNFELRWTGIIDDQPFTETTYSVQCVDNSKDIFKNSPVQSVNDASFADAPEESQDKVIPIALGRVAYSPLVNVKKAGSKSDLVGFLDGTRSKVCASLSYNSTTKTIRLYTSGVQFAANDIKLTGKYLVVIAGGATQSILILSNAASVYYSTIFPSGGWATDCILSQILDVVTGAAYKAWGNIADQDVWYFNVCDYTPTLVASQNPIYSIINNANNSPALSTYSSDLRKFTDVSEIRASQSTTNIQSTGHPGVSVVSKSTSNDGSIYSYLAIVPARVRLVTRASFSAGDLPAVLSDAPLLNDKSDSSFYTTTVSMPGGGNLEFYLYLPADDSLKRFDELYVLTDLSHKESSAGGSPIIRLTAWGVDVYGRQSSDIFTSQDVFSGSVGTAEVFNYLLPGFYVGADRDDTLFYNTKSLVKVNSLIDDTKKVTAYNVIRLMITCIETVSTTYTLYLREIGVVGRMSVAVTNDTVYVPVRGETFASTYDSRQVSDGYPQNPVQALEKLIRDYDVTAPKWALSRAYVIGSKVRGTQDTGHIFVCTVAGTSSTTEPTWTDTAGATYTDGGVTWKEFQEIPIDTASFDLAGTQRAGWLIGRTLTEKKASADWYKEICEQAFLILTMDAKGRVSLKAWRENTTPLVTFDNSNILEGTLGEMKPTPTRRIYNDLALPYQANPGSGKFNKRIFVTNIDQPAFPAETVLLDGTTQTVIGITLIYYTYPVNGQYQIGVNCSAAHGLHAGDYAALSGNTDGYNFPPTLVSITAADSFRFLTSQAPTALTSTSGTLVKTSTSTVKWKTFVGGIGNYATAKALWDQCHASYLITKSISGLPKNLGECNWYIDPGAVDPGGTRLWPELVDGDDHSAVFLAQNYANWTAWSKKQPQFEVVDNATFSALGIGDPANFNDAKLTGGLPLLGWIHEKTQLPGTDTLPPRFRFGLTLNPEALVDPISIIESGSQTDTITESGSQTNTYTEGP